VRRICSIEDCDRVCEARGLCGLHYRRLLRSGAARPRERAVLPFWEQACMENGWSLIRRGKRNRVVEKLKRAERMVGREQAHTWMHTHYDADKVLELATEATNA
jgi:hypothetical protein